MSVARAIAQAKAFCTEELGLQANVVGAAPDGEGWRVTLEAIIEAEYMRQRAHRDLVGVYEVLLDQSLAVTAFERREVRERGTTSANP